MQTWPDSNPNWGKEWGHVTRDGRLQEWLYDFEEAEPGHRHIMHTFALHPANDISVEGTPELAAALRKTIETRVKNGGGGTGWSRAWLANMWARLYDGDEALKQLTFLVGRASQDNLLTTHPPFQIDANFGGMAAVGEMLLQSHSGTVHLLPALPASWPEGRVSSIKARGGYSLDFSWKNGVIESGSIHSIRGGAVKLRASTPLQLTTSDGSAAEYSNKKIAPNVWITFGRLNAGTSHVFKLLDS